MHKAVPILALVAVLAGCGGSDTPDPTPTATATVAATDGLSGYSEGVREYYAGAQLDAADDPGADAETKYFQPPRPAEANLGDKIRLTGANIGVQVDVTPTTVEQVEVDGDKYTAVDVQFNNDAGGITVLDGEIPAELTYADGKAKPPVKDVKAPSCKATVHVRIDVGDKHAACLLFPASDTEPERLQLSLETVPVTAGGIWNLKSR
jgi:hypothetical protein